MPSTVQRLHKLGLIKPPSHIIGSIAYEAIVGSVSYGVTDDTSDMDVQGFSIPPKYMIFPHMAGIIKGFGDQGQNFEQWIQHHVICKDENRQYDFTIYSITKFFQLCMECNPNMLGVLFVPPRCILHCTSVGNIVRENRKAFLHAGALHKYKGYAHSQLYKTETKEHKGLAELIEFEQAHNIPNTVTLAEAHAEFEKRGTIQSLSHLNDIDAETYKNMYQIAFNHSKRIEKVKIQGYDTKFLYHVVRLVLECEQILINGDIDLERDREQLKAIRRGERDIKDVKDWFKEKELTMEKLYQDAITTKRLPKFPDEAKIKGILLNCLEEHYGSLSSAEIVKEDESITALRNIKNIVDNIRGIE